MTSTAPASSENWVAAGVRRELEPANELALRTKVAEAWRRPDSLRKITLLAIGPSAALVLGSLGASHISADVLPAYSPTLPGDALLTLWEVYAGTVALTLPLLILVIELARDRGLVAVRRTEVLLTETQALQVAYVSLPGIIAVGISAIYFDEDAVVFVNMLAFGLTLALILRSYRRAIELLTNPTALATKARVVLMSRLESAVRNEFVERAANDRLLQALEGVAVTSLGASIAEREPIQRHVPATCSGWVRDIDSVALKRALEPIDAPVASATAEGGDPLPTLPDEEKERPTIHMLLVGERVLQGRPLGDCCMVCVNVDDRGF